MRYFSTLFTALGIMIVITGCSSNFLVYKDGKHFYLSSSQGEVKTLLCDSGDLKKILTDSKLPEELQGELFKNLCSTERSKDKIRTVIENMTRQQRSDLKSSFQQNGYDINNVVNC